MVKLVTCVSKTYDRVSMHGVRRELIEAQADALGLPLDFVVIPTHDSDACPMKCSGPGTDFPPNDVYSRTFLAALARLEGEGNTTAASDILAVPVFDVESSPPAAPA